MLTDFDGTLAHIQDDPGTVRPVAGAVDVLSALARTYAVVAVITGRPASFVHAQLGDDVAVAGLYGLERIAARSAGLVTQPADAARWRAAVDAVATQAEASRPPGVRVERKGLAVTIHCREAPEAQPWVTAFAAHAAAQHALVVHPAKMSLELRPPVAVDKGTVVAELVGGLAAACFLGDDVGDLPAFAALDRFGEAGGVGYKVAVGSPELALAVREAAHVVVDGPDAAVSLLRSLL